MEKEWMRKLQYLENKFLNSAYDSTGNYEFQRDSKENVPFSPPWYYSPKYPPFYLSLKSTPYQSYSRSSARVKIENKMVNKSTSFKQISDAMNVPREKQGKECFKDTFDNGICNFISDMGADQPMKDIAWENPISDFISNVKSTSSPKLRKGFERKSIDKHTSNSRTVVEVDISTDNDMTMETLSDDSFKLSTKSSFCSGTTVDDQVDDKRKGSTFIGPVENVFENSRFNDKCRKDSRLNFPPEEFVVFKPDLDEISNDSFSEPEIVDISQEYLLENYTIEDMVICDSDLSDTCEEVEVTKIRPVTKLPLIVNNKNNQRNSETPCKDETSNVIDNSTLTSELIVKDLIDTTASFLSDPSPISVLSSSENYSQIKFQLLNSSQTKVETIRKDDPIIKNSDCSVMSPNSPSAVSSITKSQVDSSRQTNNTSNSVPKLSPELIMQVKAKYKKQQLSNSKKNLSQNPCFGEVQTPLNDGKVTCDSTLSSVTEYDVTLISNANESSNSNDVNELKSKEEMLRTLSEGVNSSKLQSQDKRRQITAKIPSLSESQSIKDCSKEVQWNYPRFQGDRTPLRDENNDSKCDTPVSSAKKYDYTFPLASENDTTLPFPTENDLTIPLKTKNDIRIPFAAEKDKKIPIIDLIDTPIPSPSPFPSENDVTLPFTLENDDTLPFEIEEEKLIPVEAENILSSDESDDEDALHIVIESEAPLPLLTENVIESETPLPPLTENDISLHSASENVTIVPLLTKDEAIPKVQSHMSDKINDIQNVDFDLNIALINLNEILRQFPSLKLGFDFIIKSFDAKLDTRENLIRTFKDLDNKLLFLIANDLIEDAWQHSKDNEYLEALKYCRLILLNTVEDMVVADF